jgi:hypothetical protein
MIQLIQLNINISIIPSLLKRGGGRLLMRMIETSKIIYSINIEDVQNVAEEELGRKLTKKELGIIEDKLGDHIDWYNAIDIAIQNEILH